MSKLISASFLAIETAMLQIIQKYIITQSKIICIYNANFNQPWYTIAGELICLASKF